MDFQDMGRQGFCMGGADQFSSRWGGVRTLKHGLQLRLAADGGTSHGRASWANNDGRDSAIHAGCRCLIREELALTIPAASNPSSPLERGDIMQGAGNIPASCTLV
jgi:hypothetical protein